MQHQLKTLALLKYNGLVKDLSNSGSGLVLLGEADEKAAAYISAFEGGFKAMKMLDI